MWWSTGRGERRKQYKPDKWDTTTVTAARAIINIKNAEGVTHTQMMTSDLCQPFSGLCDTIRPDYGQCESRRVRVEPDWIQTCCRNTKYSGQLSLTCVSMTSFIYINRRYQSWETSINTDYMMWSIKLQSDEPIKHAATLQAINKL